jgi:hypothetical protein
MKLKPSAADLLWIAVGTAVLALLLLATWVFRDDASPARQLAFKAERIDRVRRTQLAIASASEAEKSAVLATTDEDSRTYADQARAATAEAERERLELGGILATDGTPQERELLARFSEAFANLRRIDDDVLRLAVLNTNLKAYALAFGPAADAVSEVDASLAREAARHVGTPEAADVTALAFGARLGILRIQGLLAPHIAEESDAGMDRMEAAMAAEEQQVRKDLDGLAALPATKGDADVAVAAAAFARYGELKVRILALSRQNTNVRSLALSLDQKRKAMTVCLDALDALQQAFQAEPIRGVTYGQPVHPR